MALYLSSDERTLDNSNTRTKFKNSILPDFLGCQDNLTPGQFDTADNLTPPMLADNLTPGQFDTGQFDTADNLTPDNLTPGQFDTGQFDTRTI